MRVESITVTPQNGLYMLDVSPLTDDSTPYGDGDKKVSSRELEKLLRTESDKFNKNNTYIKISIHEKSNQILVRILDAKTDETIKEIPPEKIIDLIYNLCEQAGLFIDKRY